MLKFIFLFTGLIITSYLFAGNGDTLKYQVIDFSMRGDVKEKWVVFPDSTKKFEKILMIYSLKCDPLNTPYKCGEWDYLTYTHAAKKTGKFKEFPNFMVDDAVTDSFSYINKSGWKYELRNEQSREITNVLQVKNTFAGDSANIISKNVFTAPANVSNRFLWTFNDLNKAGLLKKEIHGIYLWAKSPGSSGRLTIKMKLTNRDKLLPDSLDQNGFIVVYDQNTSFQNAGWQFLLFNKGFLWDSTSAIIVETAMQCLTVSGQIELSGNLDNNMQNLFSKEDFSLFFEGKDYIELPVENVKTINKTVSVSFWAKGNPDYMPQNTYIFEAIDASDKRILNCHLPWANSRIYWDAGNDDNGYDRIEKDAQPDEFKGKWNFWTMTKDATKGEMKIYLNGTLWHSVTGKTKSMNGIAKFVIGANAKGKNTNYDGWVDEFGVWNKVLSEQEIKSIMHKSPDANSNGLLLYCAFDEGNGMTTHEIISGKNLNLSGIPQWKFFKNDEKIKNFSDQGFKPLIVFSQGDFSFNNKSRHVVDSTQTDVITIVFYNDVNKPDIPTDTIYVWKTYSISLFDSIGSLIGQKAVKPDSVVYLSYRQATYDEKYALVDRYEIGRYITPYGINLDLGEGFTWIYDVSDYAPILRDSVRISSGNWQELHDLKFYFIEGTPPRNIKRVINLWNGYPAYNADVEKFLVPKKILIKNDEKNVRLKMRTTGHGMGGNDNCAEFCPKTHTIDVNGVKRFNHFVWRDNCAANPLYPQGGTWIYQRANWCPGAEVYTHDFELSPFVTPGDSLTVDYNLQPYTWNGQGSQPNYVIASQLITYSDFNFNNDAAVIEIIRPNKWEYYLRENPSCLNPVVVIKNTGKENLTSLLIKYGSVSTDLASFRWEGKLEPLQSAEVELPFYWGNWNGNNQFRVNVSLPNGKTDEYEYNNTKIATFNYPAIFSNELLFYLKTNNAPNETAYRLTDVSGKIWYERKFNTLAANKLYIDTFVLPKTYNCYRLEIFDNDEDGLNFWANNDGGGTARLKAKGGVFYPAINPDFGSYIAYNFTTGWNVNVDEPMQVSEISLFPNPVKDKAFLEVNFSQKNDVLVNLTDLYGKTIFSKKYASVSSDILEIELNEVVKGIYFLNVIYENKNSVFKMIVE